MIDFTLFDSMTFRDELVEKFEEGSSEVLAEGDERNTIINTMLYIAEVLMNEINAQANNNLVAFCDMAHLIYFGMQQDTYRLEATKATCMVRFTISDQADSNVIIPAGTRVTADGEVFFATDAATTIAPDSYADIPCTATEAGAQGNGYSVGQINILANTIAYVDSVSNTTASAGGSDIQSEEDFREDVLYAPLKYNTTGSEGAYIQKTKEVSASIADVAVTASGSNVSVYILCKNGALPSTALKDLVLEYLTKPGVKPVTDSVSVLSAVQQTYTIDMSYKIAVADRTRITEIQAAVNEAVDEYIKEIGYVMGKPINPEMLRKVAYTAGAASVTVNYPAYTNLASYQTAVCTSKTVAYDGLLGA